MPYYLFFPFKVSTWLDLARVSTIDMQRKQVGYKYNREPRYCSFFRTSDTTTAFSRSSPDTLDCQHETLLQMKRTTVSPDADADADTDAEAGGAPLPQFHPPDPPGFDPDPSSLAPSPCGTSGSGSTSATPASPPSGSKPSAPAAVVLPLPAAGAPQSHPPPPPWLALLSGCPEEQQGIEQGPRDAEGREEGQE